MGKGIFNLTTTCAYCLRETGKEIDCVLPVFDWKTNKLLGYYCKDHYILVKAKNINSSHFGLEEYDCTDILA
ncbi:MAG TPA: hypothetical protein VIG80_15620 [Bacillaceae bacterium]